VQGGSVVSRRVLLEEDLLPACVAVNALSTLYMAHESLYETDVSNDPDDLDNLDPLDHTRIHPEDYPIAHEIVINILGLDPEDYQNRAQHDQDNEDWPKKNISRPVIQLLSDQHVERKIASLDIEAYAKELTLRSGKRSRFLVSMVAKEIVEPYQDTRGPFTLPNELDVLKMLTGETLETLDRGRIITAHVSMVKPEVVYIKLDSGVTGEIPQQYILDGNSQVNAKDLLNKSQAVRGVVVSLRAAELYIELSIRQADVARAASEQLAHNRDRNFDSVQEDNDKAILLKQKRVREAGLPRVIDHPSWKHVNKAQAESMLSDKQVGEAVIRPSHKGVDHIAVTWKVAEGIYQHIGKASSSERRDAPQLKLTLSNCT
jgi:transcription elongation factor SPT6